MGSGDWNDGMDQVGAKGKGESVWLAFFRHTCSSASPLSRARGDTTSPSGARREAAGLRGSIEQHGWDGEWYRRAYFDDGSPLGSAGNAECRIDSIAQSWSVLSGAGDAAARARRDGGARPAPGSPRRRPDPAARSAVRQVGVDPGYIKGYVPGVRENGGQYTHAAIWAAMAFAELGDSRRAWELFTMINPVNHAETPAAIATYKVEPYVMAADVYAAPPHTGRGGWTWYTGSAGWMYRRISLLGLGPCARSSSRAGLPPSAPSPREGPPATTKAANRKVANSLLAALPGRNYQRLLSGLEPVEFKFGDVLYEPGQKIRYVYFPDNSLVSLLTVVDGRMALEVGMVGREGMVGLPLALGMDVSPVRALVQGAGTALQMDSARFSREIRRSPQLQLRGSPLRECIDGAGLPNRRVQSLPRRSGAPCPLAADDPRPRALRRIPPDPRISCAHAGGAAGRRHRRRAHAAGPKADRLQPRQHQDPRR